MELYDNFLNPYDFDKLEQEILSSNFQWSWCENTISPNDLSNRNTICNQLDSFQFYNLIYQQYEPYRDSSLFKLLKPVFNKLKITGLVRVKANLTTRTPSIIEHGYHVDSPIKCKTGILYINDSDGYTIFDNGEKVNSVRNRFVEFDSQIMHSGTSCTSTKRRIVINFNYYRME